MTPQQLGYQSITENQSPEVVLVGTRHAVENHVLFVDIAAVPGCESLDDITVEDHQARREHDSRHQIDVPDGDEVAQAIDGPNRDGEC